MAAIFGKHVFWSFVFSKSIGLLKNRTTWSKFLVLILKKKRKQHQKRKNEKPNQRKRSENQHRNRRLLRKTTNRIHVVLPNFLVNLCRMNILRGFWATFYGLQNSFGSVMGVGKERNFWSCLVNVCFQTCVNRIGRVGKIFHDYQGPWTGTCKLVTVFHEAGITATVNIKIIWGGIKIFCFSDVSHRDQ